MLAGLDVHTTHGFTISMMTYLGLHALVNDASYMPSLCSEYKRRQVAQLNVHDKLGVAFSGRPPLITRQYCSTPLPLDLSDEELLSDPETLIRAVQSLDSAGWNTRGVINPATVIRARCMLATFREEAMEVSFAKISAESAEHMR